MHIHTYINIYMLYIYISHNMLLQTRLVLNQMHERSWRERPHAETLQSVSVHVWMR